MKGFLQFAELAEPTVFKYLGTIRPKNGRDFTIVPILDSDRNGDPEDVGYTVQVNARSLNINTDLFNSNQHYFRIIYPDTLEMIELDYRKYNYGYDGLITRNNIEYHDVTVSFNISVAELTSFNEIVPLPESEGGVVVEDGDVYVE